jgi:hypothetical protein
LGVAGNNPFARATQRSRVQARCRAALVLAALAGLALLAGMPSAAAHPESAAPSLRPDVVRAGHEPAVVQPHTQWQGFIDLRAGTNVTSAYYQVCRVGQACFAPPTPAAALVQGDGTVTFRFDTSTYLANGQPVDYEPGWRVGVTWVLEERLSNGTFQSTRFPEGPDILSEECQGGAASACAEAHYLAFDIADAPTKEAPALPASGLAGAFAAAAALARRRRD